MFDNLSLSAPLKHMQMAVPDDLALSLPYPFPNDARFVMLRCEGAPIRWRDDGTNPQSDQGMLMFPEDEPLIHTAFQKLLFTATATGAKLNIAFYG